MDGFRSRRRLGETRKDLPVRGRHAGSVHRLPLCFALLLWAAPAFAQSAEDLYRKAAALDQAVRVSDHPIDVGSIRAAVAAYALIVRRFPRSGYCDDALWRAAALAQLAYERHGDPRDRHQAERILRWLTREYPTSPFVKAAQDELAPERRTQTDPPRPQSPATLGRAPSRASAGSAGPPPSAGPHRLSDAASFGSTGDRGRKPGTAVLHRITRSAGPDLVRVTMELDREVLFTTDSLENPARLFLDLTDTAPSTALRDASLTYEDHLVRGIRVGRHPNRTRVVLDVEGVARHSVFTLYGPFRIVIDCEPNVPPVPLPPPPVLAARPLDPAIGRHISLPLVPPRPAVWTLPVLYDVAPAPGPPPAKPAIGRDSSHTGRESPPLPSIAAAPPSHVPAPVSPAANLAGGYSMARQLGLGVSRIVIDPGHGGHDPGARARGVTEAEIALDIALRLEKLLLKEGQASVVLTRRTNVYVPLEERTAIANREGADLFVSVHVNASRNASLSGVETFFLNFASTPYAAAVAARENAGSGQTMNKLPDIVKVIALNNKLDESRDLATFVQTTLVDRLKPVHRQIRDLGVKQAPFIVLIGASMPSVLAEVSFLTNRTEAALLKTASYRQRIAEALHDGIRKYQRALKSAQTTQ